MASIGAGRHSHGMRKFLFALLFISTLAWFASAQSVSAAANPLGLYFDESFNNIPDYYHPGALLVAGNCNRDDERFAAARKAGAEVLAYFNPIEIYDRLPCKQNAEFYMGGNGRVPLWPFPAPGVRVNISECDGDWCTVSAGQPGERANFSGYVRQEEIWGVYPDEVFD